jgi:hypothetical protein
MEVMLYFALSLAPIADTYVFVDTYFKSATFLLIAVRFCQHYSYSSIDQDMRRHRPKSNIVHHFWNMTFFFFIYLLLNIRQQEQHHIDGSK